MLWLADPMMKPVRFVSCLDWLHFIHVLGHGFVVNASVLPLDCCCLLMLPEFMEMPNDIQSD